ncbi:MAG: diaminopimelate epimerase [Acidimicrobiaceae bacterium]|nr:diaminopimelate epimerase [Acidimicrobiaceae bacterium]
MALRYSKHHGLGNDFLVLLTDSLPPDAVDQSVALCDRRTGIGADGLIYGVTSEAHELSMNLFNSDGSSAAVSGNGLRCLVQAVARRRSVAAIEIEVETPAGMRRCSASATDSPKTVVATIEMGTVAAGPAPDVEDLMGAVAEELGEAGAESMGVRRWETCDIGNPHVICHVDDPDEIVLDVVGPAIERHFADGANVSFVAVDGNDQLELRVWERGAGVTSACGTGATVAGHVFRRWGLIGPKSVVRMPGGDAVVDLSGPLTLTGPATHVADIEVSDV